MYSLERYYKEEIEAAHGLMGLPMHDSDEPRIAQRVESMRRILAEEGLGYLCDQTDFREFENLRKAQMYKRWSDVHDKVVPQRSDLTSDRERVENYMMSKEY